MPDQGEALYVKPFAEPSQPYMMVSPRTIFLDLGFCFFVSLFPLVAAYCTLPEPWSM